jgi:eukaryotic-like serine/threonine-protein kinase
MATHRAPTATRSTRKHASHTIERPATRSKSSARSAQPLAPPAPTAYSSESRRTYRLDRLIGKGGFGEVYLATPSPATGIPAQVCVKISDRLSGWLREAYFAELLYREDRALKVYDRFAEPSGTGMRYCLAMEYADHGDLGAWLEREGAQSERFVRREIAALLGPLEVLHRGHAMHRDLTPFNVFVCEGEKLKLGDFGIATHQFSRRGVTADSFNPFHVPNEIAWGRVRRWQQRDDIYQIGLLAAMLLRGDITSDMRSKDVRLLPCSDHLKEVIHCCLGSRGKRYESARELSEALRKRPKEPSLGRVKGLKGVRLSFTGFLERPRADAIAAARKAGALVQSKPGPSTDVLVRGRPNAQQIAGRDGGSKLIEVRRLAKEGIKVTIIDERQFWRLAAPPARAGTKAAAKGKSRR